MQNIPNDPFKQSTFGPYDSTPRPPELNQAPITSNPSPNTPNTSRRSPAVIYAVFVIFIMAVSIFSSIIDSLDEMFEEDSTIRDTARSQQKADDTKDTEKEPTSTSIKLLDNQIAIGLNGTAMYTADTFEDSVRNAAKRFTIYGYVSPRTQYRGVVADVEDFLAPEKANLNSKVYILTNTDNNINYPAISISRGTEFDQNADPSSYVIQLDCLYESVNFNLEDAAFSCKNASKDKLENLLGTFSEKSIEGLSSRHVYGITYKNHYIEAEFLENYTLSWMTIRSAK